MNDSQAGEGTRSSEGEYRRRRRRRPPARRALTIRSGDGAAAAGPADDEPPYPASGADFPPHVEFLLVGAGTASFAAMRAIRAARPAAQVLLVGDERALPYMRPPLSKELWREPELAARAAAPDGLSFRQWNGRRRSVLYEPGAFYAPVERLAGAGGAGVARGWQVLRLDVARHEALLAAPGRAPVTLGYGKCLLATGARPRRLPALAAAAARGLALPLRSLRDAAELARQLDRPRLRTVAVVGGGFLACELSAALAERLRGSGKEVLQLVSEDTPMAAVLPAYLAHDAARRLSAAGVRLLRRAEVAECAPLGERLRLRLADGAALDADLVVECAGAEPDSALADASGLETHPELGGLLVNAELQARSDVYAAGDAACFYDVVLGRRRVEHHDHAVVSGRLAGENMAAVAPPKHYTHQSMFWSDLGPQLGYEVGRPPRARLRRATPTRPVWFAGHRHHRLAPAHGGRVLGRRGGGGDQRRAADLGGCAGVTGVTGLASVAGAGRRAVAPLRARRGVLPARTARRGRAAVEPVQPHARGPTGEAAAGPGAPGGPNDVTLCCRCWRRASSRTCSRWANCSRRTRKSDALALREHLLI